MDSLTNTNSVKKRNWFVKRIIKHQIISFTVGLLLISQLTTCLATYFSDKDRFSEVFVLNIWGYLILALTVYFLQWLLAVWIASKFTKDTLKQKFLKHPLATVILFISYIIDLPVRLAEYNTNGFIQVFELIVYYAFTSFIWWLLICWISGKVLKRQRFQWRWYKKTIDLFFCFMPFVYKLVLGLIVASILFFVIFFLLAIVFKYSGQDLNALFN